MWSERSEIRYTYLTLSTNTLPSNRFALDSGEDDQGEVRDSHSPVIVVSLVNENCSYQSQGTIVITGSCADLFAALFTESDSAKKISFQSHFAMLPLDAGELI